MNEHDLTDFLRDWPLEVGRINARKIIGIDDKPKLQVRVDLGVLQMECEGRPDGLRPEGYESQLALQRHRQQQYQAHAESSSGFILAPEECRVLRDEAMQYYHRYVALFAISEYESVINDTTHILDMYELCRDFGPGAEDRVALEPFRSAAVTMRARAKAEIAVQSGQNREALSALENGLQELRIVFQENGRSPEYEHSNEVTLLRGMREVLVPKLPASQRAELQERIQAAITAENYELAAILRDELRMMNP